MGTYNVGNVEIGIISRAKEMITTLNTLYKNCKSVSTALNGTAKSIDKVGNSGKKASSSLQKMFTLGKLYVFLNYTKRMAQSLAKTVQNAIDYIETLNKFKVSFGDLADRATAFQNKMSEAFGLAKIDLMNYQANFNNIIKGLGNIDVNIAYNMSETLTQMAVDFASLFNVSIDSAMTKFQSALTQQVRPIRSVSGFDVTTATLQSVLTGLGITDRTVGQLTQVEKRLLIIIALQRQMKNINAMGDFSRTIEQPANQLKILSQQLKETGIAIGDFALHYISPALKYVLGFVMAIKAIIQTLRQLTGWEEDDSVSVQIDNLEFEADDATGAVNGTTKALKDLKKATTGIDELNIIQQPEAKDTGGGTGGSIGGIDPRLTDALESYNTVLDKTKMKAIGIRDKIMEWLGFTKLVDEETGEVTWKLKDGETNFSKIVKWAKILAGVLGGIVALKIGGKLLTVFSTVSSIAKVIKGLPLFSKLAEMFAIVKGGAGTFGEAFELEFGTSLSSALTALSQIALVITGIVFAVLGIKETIEGFKLNEVDTKLQGILKTAGGIALIVGGIAGATPVGIIADIIGVALIAWSYVVKFREKIDEILNKIWGFTEKLYPFLKPVHKLIKGIMGFAKKIVEAVKVMWNNTVKIFAKIGEIGKKIGEIAKAIGKIFNQYIWTPIKNKAKEIWNWIKEKIITPLYDFLKPFIDVLDKYIFTPIKNFFDKIKTWFSALKDWLLEKLADIINLPAKGAQGLINLIIRGLNAIIKKLNEVPGINIELISELSLDMVSFTTKKSTGKAKQPKAKNGSMAYATGGFPTRGDYFLANENGVPEYVGSIGNRTAVANTNQIIQGISYGVSMAQSEQNALLRQQNALLQQLLAKEGGNVYLDGRKVSSEIDRVSNARGAKLVKGGFAYGY